MAPRKPPRGIDRLPSGLYRVRIYTAGKRHTVGSKYQTLGDARAALSIAKADIARDQFVPPAQKRATAKTESEQDAREQITVDQVAEQFWTFLKATGKTQGTIYTYQSRYRSHIKPSFGSRPVTDVSVADIEHWYAVLLKDKGQGVARSVYLTISSLFNYAAGKAHGLNSSFEPYISSSPVQVSGATKHRPERREGEPVATPEQVAFIASNVGNYRLAILLSAWAAIRLGELLALTRADITEGDGFYWLRISKQVQARGEGLYETEPKSEAGFRSVPVPAALNDDVVAHLKSVPKSKVALLFPRTGGTWTHPNTLRNRFNTARDAWNEAHPDDVLSDFTFHSLRHTALTRVGQAGATLEELKRYAGHSSAEVVAKYQHATKDRLAMLAATMSGQIMS